MYLFIFLCIIILVHHEIVINLISLYQKIKKKVCLILVNHKFPEILRRDHSFANMFAVLQVLLVSCCGCFHGRTLGVISMSCDNDATRGFGPLVPGHLKVDFGDIDGLKKVFEGTLSI